MVHNINSYIIIRTNYYMAYSKYIIILCSLLKNVAGFKTIEFIPTSRVTKTER